MANCLLLNYPICSTFNLGTINASFTGLLGIVVLW